MQIDNEFKVGVPVERAWEVLTDLEGIAPCMPGAQLTGVEGEVYSGRVKVKVGPVVAEYAGTATFEEKDEAAHRAVISASGRDSRGAGNASARIVAQLRAEGGHTIVTVDTDLRIAGKIAQLGRGMIKEVSTKLLAQFVHCLEAKLTHTPAPSPQPAASDVAAPAARAGAPAEAPGRHAAPVEPTMSTEPLDLMSVAGGSIVKRVVPLALVVLVLAAVIVYLIVR